MKFIKAVSQILGHESASIKEATDFFQTENGLFWEIKLVSDFFKIPNKIVSDAPSYPPEK